MTRSHHSCWQNVPTGKSELTKLHTDKKKQFGPLVRWLKVMVAVSPFLEYYQLHFPTFRSTLVKVSQHGFTWRPWESLLSLSWGDLLNSLLIFPFGLFNNLRRPSFPMDKIVFSRFGLPVNFQGMVVLPQKKQATYPFNSVWKYTSFLQVKKLRECLNDIYFHLDSAGG